MQYSQLDIHFSIAQVQQFLNKCVRQNSFVLGKLPINDVIMPCKIKSRLTSNSFSALLMLNAAFVLSDSITRKFGAVENHALF
jgi:hypothetical protein